ncbi:MAG TPA: hypothetical protein PLI93_05115 [Gemmatimonadales bacterium]|nr:hypothetical protein [Gemmatimonadales bacterium]MCB9517574.1 hypothetical protein [Gemmatimonadales bacterium]HPF61425.1 hypothetical protein [Gemmatimonadales bacterium]HRX17677.1 hypothetical protein [Gemmatimonadales bacterium]
MFDYGDMRLKAFSSTGVLRWQVGRSGAGPGEYRNPTELRVRDDGRIVLRDPPNARILELSPLGSPLRTIPVVSQNHRMLALSGQRFMLLGGSHTDFAIIVDSAGGLLATTPLGAEQMDVPVVSRQAVAGQASDGGAAIAFVYSGSFATVTPTGEMQWHEGVEAIPFPKVLTLKVGDKKQYTAARVDPKAPRGARSVAVGPRAVYLLFGGESADAGRLIDEYDRQTGRYTRSWRVPEGVVSILVCGSQLLMQFNDPLPHFRVFPLPALR